MEPSTSWAFSVQAEGPTVGEGHCCCGVCCVGTRERPLPGVLSLLLWVAAETSIIEEGGSLREAGADAS